MSAYDDETIHRAVVVYTDNGPEAFGADNCTDMDDCLVVWAPTGEALRAFDPSEVRKVEQITRTVRRSSRVFGHCG